MPAGLRRRGWLPPLLWQRLARVPALLGAISHYACSDDGRYSDCGPSSLPAPGTKALPMRRRNNEQTISIGRTRVRSPRGCACVGDAREQAVPDGTNGRAGCPTLNCAGMFGYKNPAPRVVPAGRDFSRPFSRQRLPPCERRVRRATPGRYQSSHSLVPRPMLALHARLPTTVS
jgi:hypothetical protein